jgi:hypothetical protein
VQRFGAHLGQETSWTFNGQVYRVETVTALVFKYLARNAESAGCRPGPAVIAAPAAAGTLEREALRNAGVIAGLTVREIVPGPVAALAHYDIPQAGRDRFALVYDPGGSSLTTTVVRIGGDRAEVVCVGGVAQLGGVDWDSRLMQDVLEQFLADARPASDPRDDEMFLQELALRIEEVKRGLSQVGERRLPLRFAGATSTVTVTRDRFEQITDHLLEATMEATERTLQEFAAVAGLADPLHHVDEVVLVGGATRMPAVSARLVKRFGWQPRLHEPDLAVAKGTARLARSGAAWDWETGQTRRAAGSGARSAGFDAQRYLREVLRPLRGQPNPAQAVDLAVRYAVDPGMKRADLELRLKSVRQLWLRRVNGVDGIAAVCRALVNADQDLVRAVGDAMLNPAWWPGNRGSSSARREPAAGPTKRHCGARDRLRATPVPRRSQRTTGRGDGGQEQGHRQRRPGCRADTAPAGARSARAMGNAVAGRDAGGRPGRRRPATQRSRRTAPDRGRIVGGAYRIRRAMIDSSARNRIVILDCCFAGRAIEWMAAPGGPDAGHLDISGTHVLTATSATRHAHAPEGARHTAFTAALIDLLRRGTPDAGSLIRISDIYPNLVRALRSRGLPTPQQRGTDAIGDLALTRNPAWR